MSSVSPVPAGSTNGTALGSFPAGATKARLYLIGLSTITFTVAPTAPSSPPTATFTVSAALTGNTWDEPLSASQMIYVTATTGSPMFRWLP